MSENTYRQVDDFVQREVYACISDMAEYLFDWEGERYASYDEWDNIYKPHCPKCNGIIDTNAYDDGDDEFECPDCGCMIDTNSIDFYCEEIYEYWLVSPYLGEKLRENGEAVLERYGAWVWGRTCTGQAIALDWVIENIALGNDNKSK